MNLDTKSTVANAIYSANEMSKTASSTQLKRFGNSNTSFAATMKNSSEKDETKSSVSETETAPETTKSENQEEIKKTENKHTDKTNSEQKETSSANNDTISDNQTYENSQFSQNQSQDNNQQQNAYTPLTSQIQSYMSANGVGLNFASINPMSATTQAQLNGMISTVDYSAIQMSDTDAKFFADLVAKTDMTAASVAAEFDKAIQNGNIKMVQSTAKASTALIEALKESAKNHQAFRVDFDKDISVILQVDKSGKINANFIPGDKAVEAYLRNNIESLRQRFNEENIAYGDINYSQSRRNKENRDKNNNKENTHE